jgi:hypothetical protein
LLLGMSPGRRTYQIAQAVALLSLVVLLSVVPFAKVQLAQLPSFIPTYESALILNDLITAVLLFGQFAITRSRAMLALASGYLFTATVAGGHLLSFPGLFAPSGLLGAGPQSTAWIYMFWHAGFPLFVIAYAVLKDREEQQPDRFTPYTLTGRTTLLTIAAVVGAAVACVQSGLYQKIAEIEREEDREDDQHLAQVYLLLCTQAMAAAPRRPTNSFLSA